jgi:hypothetical protein
MALRRNLTPANLVFSAPPSRARPTRPALIRRCMERYISPILVTSVLDKALRARGLSDGPLSMQALHEIVEESMVGLRLFVHESKLPALMVELAEILDEEED